MVVILICHPESLLVYRAMASFPDLQCAASSERHSVNAWEFLPQVTSLNEKEAGTQRQPAGIWQELLACSHGHPSSKELVRISELLTLSAALAQLGLPASN